MDDLKQTLESVRDFVNTLGGDSSHRFHIAIAVGNSIAVAAGRDVVNTGGNVVVSNVCNEHPTALHRYACHLIEQSVRQIILQLLNLACNDGGTTVRVPSTNGFRSGQLVPPKGKQSINAPD